MVTILEHKNFDLNEVKDDSFIMKNLYLDITDLEEMKTMIIDESYKKIILMLNNNVYVLYHGFPHDIPLGIIVTYDNEKYLIGDHNNISNVNRKDIKIIDEWYNELTNNGCDYLNIIWQMCHT